MADDTSNRVVMALTAILDELENTTKAIKALGGQVTVTGERIENAIGSAAHNL